MFQRDGAVVVRQEILRRPLDGTGLAGYADQRHPRTPCSPSGYFKAMFESQMREKEEKEITLHNLTPIAVKSLVEYAYTGQVTASQSPFLVQ